MPPDPDCPFCTLSRSADGLVASFPDAYPVSPGHTLIVPRRHVARWADVTPAERAAMWARVDDVRDALEAEHLPDGFNVGLNDGAAAGQTVPHLHMHVIPRFSGDMDDPRGGVRHVIPAKAKYWA